MPYDKLDVETDGDSNTAYEDLEAHERISFFANEPAEDENREANLQTPPE
ncbi:MAG TPA: hypothetical protein VMS09_00510 [Paenibacillus sp.]|nr:hypothetical protein [Paenibacillus sp.]HUC90489.1 hypothetical protein [Paenibacillus sp.]